jgi:hypothetical protein
MLNKTTVASELQQFGDAADIRFYFPHPDDPTKLGFYMLTGHSTAGKKYANFMVTPTDRKKYSFGLTDSFNFAKITRSHSDLHVME